MASYEKLLEQDDTDAEAHWGAVISRYGIEYVEDPVSRKRIPTCHRIQVASILADADYLSAVENAPDAASRDLYKQQAAEIAGIQKGILAISANEKPYDVFICYKETDENGQRTRDSQWAQDVYYGLTEQGYKVFFSRITLEDKLGQQYEPYIFAALNSAKVMVVIGSKPEYFNAVWVKNEWSRYLALMAKDRKRLLIPCYRDMDPYDLPEELSSLQSQDMSKIGFMQDLLRGVKKVLDADRKTEQPTMVQQEAQTIASTAGNNVAPLLRRAYMFLEDRDWNSANEYCEKVLDIEPENARAYMGKLMAELRVAKEEQLREQPQPFDGVLNYQKAIRFGDAQLKKKLEDDTQYIHQRNEHQRQAEIFDSGKETLSRACTCADCRSAADIFKTIPLFDGVKAMLTECAEKEESIRNDLYTQAVRAMQNAGESGSKWNEVKKKLDEKELNNYRDVAELRAQAAKRYDDYLDAEKKVQGQQREIARREAEVAATKKKRNRILGVLLAVIVVAAFFVVTKVIIPNNNYHNAVTLMDAGKYEDAIVMFTALDGYNDSATQIKECKYLQARALNEAGKYTEAYALYVTISGYKDADNLVQTDHNLVAVADAVAAAAAAREAKVAPFRQVGNYVTFGHYEQDNVFDNVKEDVEWLVLDVQGDRVLLVSRYALDCQKYNNTKETNVTWETCSLRTWLNGTFINAAFTMEEQNAVLITTVDNSNSQGYSGFSISGGNNTQDKIFLLSYAEAWKYFENDDARKCQPTQHAKAQDAYKKNGNSVWWLRSPGPSSSWSSCFTYVNYDGVMYYHDVNKDQIAVRPAFWLDLTSDIF